MLVDPKENVSRRRACYLAAVKAEICAVAGDAERGDARHRAGRRSGFRRRGVARLLPSAGTDPMRRRGDFAEVRTRGAARAAPVRAILDEAKRSR
jgi:hypothetical protein